jgi:hypothetical protein
VFRSFIAANVVVLAGSVAADPHLVAIKTRHGRRLAKSNDYSNIERRSDSNPPRAPSMLILFLSAAATIGACQTTPRIGESSRPFCLIGVPKRLRPCPTTR